MTPTPAPALLAALHDRFGGQANLAVLAADGSRRTTTRATARTRSSPSSSGRIGVVSTGLYSIDRSLFQFVAPEATRPRLVRWCDTTGLDR